MVDHQKEPPPQKQKKDRQKPPMIPFLSRIFSLSPISKSISLNLLFCIDGPCLNNIMQLGKSQEIHCRSCRTLQDREQLWFIVSIVPVCEHIGFLLNPILQA